MCSSPENFLAFDEFDNTPNRLVDGVGLRKSWEPHVQDYNTGDPTWRGGMGKGILGAINYLSGQGMRAFSFLTMNIIGDDQNVFPYVSDEDFLRMASPFTNHCYSALPCLGLGGVCRSAASNRTAQ